MKRNGFLAIGAFTILLCGFLSQQTAKSAPPAWDEQTHRTLYDEQPYRTLYLDADFSSLYGQKLPELKAVFEKLSAVDSYMDTNFQALEVPGHWFDHKFLYAYDPMDEEDRAAYADLSNPDARYPVIAMQINQNCVDSFEIHAAEGRVFAPEDMRYTEGEPLPVLLGSAYAEFADVGYQFHGSYILKELDFVVVGILSEDSQITMNQTTVPLEHYVVMPSFDCEAPATEEDDVFQVRHYVNKISGTYHKRDQSEVDEILAWANTLEIGNFTRMEDATYSHSNSISVG